MSDDLETEYLQSREVDPELQADLNRVRTPSPSLLPPGIPGPVDVERMGRNALIAAYDTLRNVGELAIDAASARTPQDEGDADLYDIAPDFMKAADGVREQLAMDSTGEDVVAQKAMQFAIPFSATMKALGGMAQAGKVAKVARLATADAITSGTVWDPHEGRFADVLRMVAPNNELVNAATNYLASDPTDSDAEGRFKNILDSQFAGLAIGGFLFSTARTLKMARGMGAKIGEKMAQTAAVSP